MKCAYLVLSSTAVCKALSEAFNRLKKALSTLSCPENNLK